MFPFHSSKDHISHVVLSVSDIFASTTFYTKIIKLEVISKHASKVELGSKGVTLLTLVQSDQKKFNQDGLFHVALLLQHEVALANWLTQNKAYLEYFGYSDHLVSQAVYVTDPDGHGIEIYSDRPSSSWTKTSDLIVMDTLPFDLNHLVSKANLELDFQFTLGHIHLKTQKIEEMVSFYRILGFETTSLLHGAHFMSFDQYHHHVGINNWRHTTQPYRIDSLDIQSYTITYYDLKRFQNAIAQLTKAKQLDSNVGPTRSLRDPIGIRVHLEYVGETHENI